MQQAKRYLGVSCSPAGIRVGVADRAGRLCDMAVYPVEGSLGAAFLDRLGAVVLDYWSKCPEPRPRAVGLGLPGYINRERGLWMHCLSLEVQCPLPVAAFLKERLSVPVYIDNDINAASLAELHFGIGRVCGNFLFVSLDEGVAMGIVSDGKLVRGVANCAGELGHMSVETEGKLCECGYRGCLEGILAAPKLVQEAGRLLSRYPASPLAAERAYDSLTPERIFYWASEGDELSTQITERAVRALGVGLVNCLNLLNPGDIILSGATSRSPYFVEKVRRFVSTNGFVSALGTLNDVTCSALNAEEIGVLGAVCLCLEPG